MTFSTWTLKNTNALVHQTDVCAVAAKIGGRGAVQEAKLYIGEREYILAAEANSIIETLKIAA